MPLVLDLETAVVAELVAGDVLAGNVSTRLPRDFTERLPYGTLARVPGGRWVDTNTLTLEAARFQVNTRDDDELAALAAMSTLLEALKALEGTGLGDPPTIFVSAVELTPPAWNPDPESARPGYIANATLYAKGYRTVG